MTQIVELANKVIDTYCVEMNVDRKDLSLIQNKKLARVDKNGVSLSFIRQSLAHFLYKRIPIPAKELGLLIGYADHSMVSLYSRIVESHIEINDQYFMPYYERLMEIAEPMVKDLDFVRVSTYFYKSVNKKVQRIRLVREFSV